MKGGCMPYFVVVSFDLKNADAGDQDRICGELKNMGLAGTLTGHDGRVSELPTRTVAGKFSGSSARNVRNDVCTQVGTAFRKCRVKGKILISVGGNWDWGVRNA